MHETSRRATGFKGPHKGDKGTAAFLHKLKRMFFVPAVPS
jgi:hypothetical protein